MPSPRSPWRDAGDRGVLGALDAAWEKAGEPHFRAADRIDQQGGDIALQDAIGHVGPWTEAVSFMHANYDCGAPAERISTVDFARVNDDKDLLSKAVWAVWWRIWDRGFRCASGRRWSPSPMTRRAWSCGWPMAARWRGARRSWRFR